MFWQRETEHNRNLQWFLNFRLMVARATCISHFPVMGQNTWHWNSQEERLFGSLFQKAQFMVGWLQGSNSPLTFFCFLTDIDPQCLLCKRHGGRPGRGQLLNSGSEEVGREERAEDKNTPFQTALLRWGTSILHY